MSTEKVGRDKSLGTGYSELYKLEQTGDFERALKISNKILNSAPEEVIAFHCKVVCLIQNALFEEALNVIKKNPAHSQNLTFEKAYCLYRLNRSDEALKIIDDEAEENMDGRLIELRCQICYRLERFDEAFNDYLSISRTANDEYSDERETNMSAALTYTEKSLIEEHSPNIKEHTYELCFNKACHLIAIGQYLEAEKKLRQCEKLCQEFFEEEGATEEEVQVELSHVKIQSGYVFQNQGRIREAQSLYVNALKLKLDDIAMSAVACNNAVVINRDQNIFDSRKKMKVATNEQLTFKLLSRQRKYIALNNTLLLYYSNQVEQCRKACKKMIDSYNFHIPATMIEALLALKTNNYEEALRLLENCPAADDKEKLFLDLCRVQVWLMQGNREQACLILENTGSNRYRPGIVGALITLYLAEGKEEIAQKTYKDTVEWYKENKKEEGDLTNLWRQAAEFHIKNGQATIAAGSLEELLRKNPEDKKTFAQLILAYAEFDKPKAIEFASTLFTSEDIYQGLDVDTVESSVWLAAKRPNSGRPGDNSPGSAPGSPHSDGALVRQKKRKNRKKKGKLPKNCDPTVPPNPERWLPKYERTGYRKKRDRRAKDVIKGSQGTASGQAELFDFSGKQVVEVEEGPSSVEPSPATRHQPKKSQQKKKNRRR